MIPIICFIMGMEHKDITKFQKAFLIALFSERIFCYQQQGGMTLAEIGGYNASLRLELCAYYEWGLSILVEEKVCKTEDINRICHVLEGSNYMRDFQTDSHGQITAVNFTKVEEDTAT